MPSDYLYMGLDAILELSTLALAVIAFAGALWVCYWYGP